MQIHTCNNVGQNSTDEDFHEQEDKHPTIAENSRI